MFVIMFSFLFSCYLMRHRSFDDVREVLTTSSSTYDKDCLRNECERDQIWTIISHQGGLVPVHEQLLGLNLRYAKQL